MTRFSLILAFLGLAAGAWADARTDFLAAAEHQKAQRWAEAAQGYSKVTAQLPNYAPGWKALATTRYYMGDLEGASASLDRYMALQPGDAAMGRWSDQLRAKLKLPPRTLPKPAAAAPVAMPIAVPVAVATPEGILMAAPPPGADAEIVAPEAAAIINSQAATDIVALEAQEADRSAAQMAEESAAILRRRDPPRGALKLGLRLLGGWALGLGSFEHGEDVDSPTTPSSRRYNGAPAGGASAVAELHVGLGERLQLGLGAYPLLWTDTRKSSQTGSVTRSNSSEASASFLPLMAGLTWRHPITAGFSTLLSGGIGVIPATTVRVKSQTVQTQVASLSVDSVDARVEYGLAPAWRVMAGGEWSLGKRWAFDLGVQVLGASFADATGSADVTRTDQSGAIVSQVTGLAVKASAMQMLSLNLLAGLSVSF